MQKNIKLELRCVKNPDGSFNAGSYDGGNQLSEPKFSVENGSCEDIQKIYKHLAASYPNVPIQISEPCCHCIIEIT